MSGFRVEKLDVPSSAPDWSVLIVAPGPWLRVGQAQDRQVAFQWRAAAKEAVVLAGVPPLRNGTVELVAEVRRSHLGVWRVDLWLPTARQCALGLGDACQVIDQMVKSTPIMKLGWSPSASPDGEIMLHITGEAR